MIHPKYFGIGIAICWVMLISLSLFASVFYMPDDGNNKFILSIFFVLLAWLVTLISFRYPMAGGISLIIYAMFIIIIINTPRRDNIIKLVLTLLYGIMPLLSGISLMYYAIKNRIKQKIVT